MRGEEEKKRRFACPALPAGWIREEVLRSGGLSAGKFDVYYYPPGGKKVQYCKLETILDCTVQLRSKPELVRVLGDAVNLTNFDYASGTMK